MSPSVFARRYLTRFDTRDLLARETDVVVLGSGIAGLRAALEAAEYGRVLVVTKAGMRESNTFYAQGGIASAFAPSDSVETHVADTLAVGGGLCDEDVVRLVAREGLVRVRELMAWGAEFDRLDSGHLAWAREGGHSQARILHAHGDATGREVERALVDRVRGHPQVEVIEHAFAIDLLSSGDECLGVLVSVCDEPGGGRARRLVVRAGATILATGGCGRVYRETTNPAVATGDGLAMSARAGASILDIELMQFHPTVLYVAGATRALVSEAVRGEGAWLVDGDGVRFMVGQHPMAELAPRDVVSQAIVERIAETGHECCYLELGHLDPQHVRSRFPGIQRLCQRYGLDLARDRIPVRPAAHYMIGGLETDHDGASSLARLYACGEVACTLLHGANRLGSNSLLEGLVFGCRAGVAAARLAASGSVGPSVRLCSAEAGHAGGVQSAGSERGGFGIDIEDATASLRSLMWREVGLQRDGDGLRRASERIGFWSHYILAAELDEPRGWELQNMVLLGALMARQASWRCESRGVHRRRDFPELEAKFAVHGRVHVSEFGLSTPEISGSQDGRQGLGPGVVAWSETR